MLAPGGALIVGGSENLMAIAPDFKGQQYLRGMFYILKKDSDISLRTVVETPIRSPSPTPPITRKTVYDKKRPSVSDPPPPKSIPKPAPRLETKESPKPEKPRRLLNEAVISEPSAKYPTETAEKKEGEESKPSLLSVIQKKHQRGGALLDEKAKESSPKESLLDKIANRNRDQ